MTSPALARFRTMLRIRMVEEAIAANYGAQEMRCPVHLATGQEAVSAGVCSALESRDYVMGTHRSHAPYLAKGGDLKAMLAEIHGKATGCCGGWGGSMHLVDLAVNMMGTTPIVGGSLPVAVGLAFSAKLLNQDRVSVVFFGEGATEEGVFSESLNFAALHRLPVLFICEDNLYSVYSPLSVRQPRGRDRVAIAAAHGVRAERADGNDVEGVHALALRAAQEVRAGKGPAYLEFATYRWREHCGPDFDNGLGYRTEAECLAWQARCPVARRERELLEQGLATNADLQALRESIASEIEAAFAHARQSPFPDPPDFAALSGGAP